MSTSSLPPVEALNAKQQDAVNMAAGAAPFGVITGGPGTGKTTILRHALDRLLAAGCDVALCAPTGKAARRMEEQCGHEASTLHRLLGWNPTTESFVHGPTEPLDADVVIVDEVSMVDVALCAALLSALRPGARIIFVGDADQLPSVGPGNVLRDIIASNVVPVVRLDVIYRQSARSWIPVSAAAVNAGEMPHLDARDSDDFFWFTRTEAQDVADTIVSLVADRLAPKLGLDPVRDIQVLAPQHNGACGVTALNQALQQRINPPVPGVPEWRVGDHVYRVGDKVMQTRNDYGLGVMNGESGVVVGFGKFVPDDDSPFAATPKKGTPTEGTPVMRVQYPDRVVSYTRTAAGSTTLSYACTIHKFQGSQTPAVVIPVHSCHHFMWSRPLLYTAITRAERYCVLVGNGKGLKRAVSNADVTARFTGLRERLHEQCARR